MSQKIYDAIDQLRKSTEEVITHKAIAQHLGDLGFRADSSGQKFSLNQNLQCIETGELVGVLEVALKGEDEDIIYYFCQSVKGEEGWYHQDSLTAKIN